MSLLDTASLIVTPNGYKEGKLYSVIPSDGSGDLSVTRATTATRVNSAGLVELVPYNQFNYSQKFDNAYWIKSNSTVTADNTTAPDGTTTADKMTITSGFGAVYASSIPLEGTHTISCFFKKGDASSVYIDTNGTSGNIFGSLNLDTLATSSVGGAIVNVENAGNGWYRLSITASFTGTTSYIAFGILSASSNLFTYLWGAQLVQGSTAKDYQKTETRLNIPRLDYSNGTCPSLLVEPQRTNLLTYSSSFDNAAWTAQSVSLSANATTAPDGTTTADKIILANGSQTDPVVYQILDNTANTRTLTFFAKASEYNIAFGRIGGSSNSPIVLFQLSGSGSILHNQNVSTYSIEALENGWYRCSMTYSHGASFAPNVGVCSSTYSITTSGVISTGNGTSGIFIWGAQLEVGSYATSYIPTTSASVTRNADVISKTGISSLIGQTEGTIFIDVDFDNFASQTNNPVLFSLFGNATIYMQMFTGGYAELLYNTGAGNQAYLYWGGVTNGRHKIAFGYKANDFVLYVDGTQIATDTSGSVDTLSSFYFAYNNASFNPTANYNAAALWKTRLTNTQLAQLTTI